MKINALLQIFFIILSFDYSIKLYANEVTSSKLSPIILNKEEVYEVMTSSETYEDKSGSLNLEEVMHKDFSPNKKGIINFGITNSTYWIRFKLENNSLIQISN